MSQQSRGKIEDVLTLSPLQEGFLFLHLLDEEELDVYVSQHSFDLEGELDATAMRGAATALLKRHANLRASFRQRGSGQWVQVIHRDVEPVWREVDLNARPATEHEAELERIAAEDCWNRFDLSRPPLIRFTLIRLGNNRFRFMLTNHHILLDGWSMPLVLRDLMSLYISGGETGALPRTRPYRDFLNWLNDQDNSAAQEAWTAALAGLDDVALIAPDPAPVVALPGNTDIELDEPTGEALIRIARAHGLTVNTVLQGAWALTLSQTLGRDDVVFGTTVSGRPAELDGVESMVGLFINTLPLRARLDPAESVTDLLQRLQSQQARLLNHQWINLAEIQRWAKTGKLFDTALVFENYPLETSEIDSHLNSALLRLTSLSSVDNTDFALCLVAHMQGNALRMRIGNRTELCDEEFVRKIATRLVTTLRAIAGDPGGLVGRLELLDRAERHRVLEEWQGQHSRGGATRTDVVALFEKQAAATPDAVALTYAGQSLTYAELNVRTNQLAHYLAGRGVGPEQFVAVDIPRGPDLVISLIAVLKTGAAYVPIDPDYPPERIAHILNDAAPALHLTALDDLDLDGHADRNLTDTDRTMPLTPHHPAYMIYTSGSTGRPKGVVVPHSAVDNRLRWMQDAYPLGPGDRVLQKTPSSFDVSVWEFFWPLQEGASLVIAEPGGHKDPSYLSRLIREQAVTTCHFVPSMLQAFLAEPEAAGCTETLRRVFSSGEALPRDTANTFNATLPEVELHNLYGPTEATVDVTYHHTATYGTGPVPIGRPVWNTRLYVLDASLRPVPVGVLGELYIAGPQL
ncbi:AMP-binding protein, partial [Streptomyces sp. CS014]|uniref:non-ribosomal peptide synthetase n=1 Tax=Streptomyces sp. CS014 TaxID=2162707 RepID=UPI000D511A6E